MTVPYNQFGRKVKRVTRKVVIAAAAERQIEARIDSENLWWWRFFGADHEWHVLAATNWYALLRIDRGELPV